MTGNLSYAFTDHATKRTKSVIAMHKIVFTIAAILVTTPGILAQPKQDEQARLAIIHLIDQYSTSRETQDTVLLKSLLTEDIDQLVSTGEWRRGFAGSFAGMMRSSTSNPGDRTLAVEQVRFLSPTVAVVDARYEIKNANGSIRKMWSTFVVVNDKKSWRITAIRNMLPSGGS
jgi:uncharacterized protein (TIGR02246 family)